MIVFFLSFSILALSIYILKTHFNEIKKERKKEKVRQANIATGKKRLAEADILIQGSLNSDYNDTDFYPYDSSR